MDVRTRAWWPPTESVEAKNYLRTNRLSRLLACLSRGFTRPTPVAAVPSRPHTNDSRPPKASLTATESPSDLLLDQLSALYGGALCSTVHGLWAPSSSTSSSWARVSVESARRSNSTG